MCTIFLPHFGENSTKKSRVGPEGPPKTRMEQLEPVIVLTTWPSDRDPADMAATLVGERLAACVSLLPVMESVYRWRGAVERATERQVIIKTTRQAVEPLLARLRALHPYDVPELLVLPVSGGGADYLRWVGENTTMKNDE
jgi:periplasmic divalent cation tolerance protein